MKHSCEKELKRINPAQAQAKDGETWECSCGIVYVHICDESEGCYWVIDIRSKKA